MPLLLGFSGLLGSHLERAPLHDGASGQGTPDDASIILRQGGDPQEAGDSVVDSPSIEVQQRDGLLMANSGDDVVGWLSIGPRDSAECRSRIFKIPPSHPEYKNMKTGNTVRIRTSHVGYYYCFRAQDRAGSVAFRSHLVDNYELPIRQVDNREKDSEDPPHRSLTTYGISRVVSSRTCSIRWYCPTWQTSPKGPP